MKKQRLIIAVLIAFLAAGAVLLWFLTLPDRETQKANAANAVCVVKAGSTETSFDIAKIESLGASEVQVTRDTSKTEPTAYTYTGVPLKSILDALGVDASAYKTCAAKAADGYTVAYTTDEALDPDNIWVMTACDGKGLGDKASGGEGPLMLVVRKDTFSTRWCKYLTELSFE